ncbi:MAG: hypothetical protein Q9174_006906 [Haloplaca sp. 1 TL-2023]
MSSDQSRKRPAEDRLSDPPSPSQPEQISARQTPGNNKIPRRAPSESPTFSQSPGRHNPTSEMTDIQLNEERLLVPIPAVDQHLPSRIPSGELPSDNGFDVEWAGSSVASPSRPWVARLYVIHTTSERSPEQSFDRFFRSLMFANVYARESFKRQMRRYSRGDYYHHETSGPATEQIPLRLLGWSADKHISCYVYRADVESASVNNMTESSTRDDRMEAEVEGGGNGLTEDEIEEFQDFLFSGSED